MSTKQNTEIFATLIDRKAIQIAYGHMYYLVYIDPKKPNILSFNVFNNGEVKHATETGFEAQSLINEFLDNSTEDELKTFEKAKKALWNKAKIAPDYF